jgi:hypothetical protein
VSADVITAVLLVAVPITFNLAFFELGRVFDYPNILRKDPDEILRSDLSTLRRRICWRRRFNIHW